MQFLAVLLRLSLYLDLKMDLNDGGQPVLNGKFYK
jgi:hypothetical protein